MSYLNLKWLGQSGFILSSEEVQIACDLYLSDFCQKKSRLDHTRLMPIAAEPGSLDNLDHYLITHGHIDHFDPETIGPILNTGNATKFYIPSDCSVLVNDFFPQDHKRFTNVCYGQEYCLTENIRLLPVPAAHEELEKDSCGEYKCLSYLVNFDSLKISVFFAGDTISYPQQDIIIGKLIPQGYTKILILPINGRDKKRADLGFKGNLTITEAIGLYHKLNADLLVPCHFGMFALNDAPQFPDMEYFINENCQVIIPEINSVINLQTLGK